MKNITAFLLLLLLFPGFAMAQPDMPDKENAEDKKQPLRVSSERMVSEKKKQLISFYGNVVAIKGSLKVESDEMYVHTNEDQSDFNEIEALGSVIITRGDKVATGEKANYYADKQQIVLVGSPTLTENKNVATGEKVVYFFETENMEIFGSAKKRSTLVLFPKEKVKQDLIKPGVAPRATATFGESDEKAAPSPEKNSAGESTPEVAVKKESPPSPPEKITPKVAVKKESPPSPPKKSTPKVAVKKESPASPQPEKSAPEVAEKEVVKTNEPTRELKPGMPVWYTIQVGSHKDFQESLRLREELKKHGYSAYIIEFLEEGTYWYRVRIGGFKTKSSALRMVKKLEEDEKLPTLLIAYNP